MKKNLASVLIAVTLGLAASATVQAASVGMYASTAADALKVETFAPSNFTLSPERVGVPSAVTGLNYSGTTVGGPTFNRPLANGNFAPTSLSGTATAVPYDMVQFTIATAGSYTFLSTSVTPANWDNYTFLYQTSFNAASPLTNVVIGNDDNPSIGKSGFTVSLQTGVSYYLITTGFSNTNSGSFTNVLTAVPEPSTWAMVGVGLVGLMVLQRARRQVVL